MHKMVGLMKTDYSVEDLNFIEISADYGKGRGGGGGHSSEPDGSPSY